MGYEQLAWLVLSLLLSYALRPKPEAAKPAAFEDFDFPQADEGTAQCVIFGDVWVQDWMVLGVGNFRATPIVAGDVGGVDTPTDVGGGGSSE